MKFRNHWKIVLMAVLQENPYALDLQMQEIAEQIDELCRLQSRYKALRQAFEPNTPSTLQSAFAMVDTVSMFTFCALLSPVLWLVSGPETSEQVAKTRASAADLIGQIEAEREARTYPVYKYQKKW